VKVKQIIGLFFILLIISFSDLYGQNTRDEKPPFKERLFYGGNLGLQFGTITDIEISPLIGIWVLPRIGIAAGPSYRYYKDPIDRTSIYGGITYIQFIFLQDLNNIIPLGLHAGLFLQAEYELLSLESTFFKIAPYDTGRFLTGTALIGGGMSQYISQRSSLNLSLLWALNDAGYGIYSNPEIRITFIF